MPTMMDMDMNQQRIPLQQECPQLFAALQVCRDNPTWEARTNVFDALFELYGRSSTAYADMSEKLFNPDDNVGQMLTEFFASGIHGSKTKLVEYYITRVLTKYNLTVAKFKDEVNKQNKRNGNKCSAYYLGLGDNFSNKNITSTVKNALSNMEAAGFVPSATSGQQDAPAPVQAPTTAGGSFTQPAQQKDAYAPSQARNVNVTGGTHNPPPAQVTNLADGTPFRASFQRQHGQQQDAHVQAPTASGTHHGASFQPSQEFGPPAPPAPSVTAPVSASFEPGQKPAAAAATTTVGGGSYQQPAQQNLPAGFTPYRGPFQSSSSGGSFQQQYGPLPPRTPSMTSRTFAAESFQQSGRKPAPATPNMGGNDGYAGRSTSFDVQDVLQTPRGENRTLSHQCLSFRGGNSNASFFSGITSDLSQNFVTAEEVDSDELITGAAFDELATKCLSSTGFLKLVEDLSLFRHNDEKRYLNAVVEFQTNRTHNGRLQFLQRLHQQLGAVNAQIENAKGRAKECEDRIIDFSEVSSQLNRGAVDFAAQTKRDAESAKNEALRRAEVALEEAKAAYSTAVAMAEATYNQAVKQADIALNSNTELHDFNKASSTQQLQRDLANAQNEVAALTEKKKKRFNKARAYEVCFEKAFAIFEILCKSDDARLEDKVNPKINSLIRVHNLMEDEKFDELGDILWDA